MKTIIQSILWNLAVVERLKVPNDVYMVTPETYECISLCSKRDFADAISPSILRCEDYPALCSKQRMPQSHKNSYKSQARGLEQEKDFKNLTQKREEGTFSLRMRAKSWKKTRNRFKPRAFRKNTAPVPQIHRLSPCKTLFTILTFRTAR